MAPTPFDSDSHAHLDLDASPPTDSLATTSPHTASPYSLSRSCSRSSSPSRVRHSVSPEQLTSSSADHPRSQASSIKPNSRSGQSREKLGLSNTSRAIDYNPIPSQNIQHLLTRYLCPTLVLQNSGSVARDHLASERTFLAYVRTSLGMASAGVALVQLFTISNLASKSTGIPLPALNQRLQKFATPLGLLALGMALITLFIGVFRYFLVQHALPQNKFPATRLPIVLISFGLGAITVIAFGALLSAKVEYD